MKWFGKAYGCAYEADSERAEVPVGEACGRCGETILAGDTGLLVPLMGKGGATHVPYHYQCHLRGIIGGVNHQLGRCTCCGGTEPPDPPHLTVREAARAAVKLWRERTDAGA
jgi:hypothetical protein